MSNEPRCYEELTGDGVGDGHEQRAGRLGVPVHGHLFVAHALVHRGDEILFLRRRDGRYLGGRWDVPGGTVEHGESPRAAAVREAEEEVGLRVEVTDPLTHFANLDTRGRPLCFHTVTYASVVRQPGEVVLAPAEHDDFRWLPARGGLALGLVWHVRATLARLVGT